MTAEQLIRKILIRIDQDGKNGKDLAIGYVVEFIRELFVDKRI